MRIRFGRDRARAPGEDVRADEFRHIVERARAGDEAAVTTLYRLLQPRLVRYLGVLVPSEADRVAAETWIDVVGCLDRFDGDEHALYALAFGSARRRTEGLRQTDVAADPSVDPRPVVGADAARRVDDDGMAGYGVRSALAAIGRLPPDQAEVVLLRVLGELSIEEVAALLDQPPSTVGALQRQALLTLDWVASAAEVAS